MKRFLPITAAFALLLLTGLLAGQWTGRWASSEELRAAVVNLDRVPLTIEEWQGEALKVDRDQIEKARIQGYLFLRYTSSKRRETVTVLLLCGRAGPLAVHTPDICYQGAGYELEAPAVRVTRPLAGADKSAELWTGRFCKPTPAGPVRLRIFWSWSASGGWKVPANPRLTFAGAPALYKLYVIRELSPVEQGPEDDVPGKFIEELLPALNRALFSAPGS